jgi:outer membrane protein TolC
MADHEAATARRRSAVVLSGRGRAAGLAIMFLVAVGSQAPAAARPRDIGESLALAYQKSPELLGAQRALQAANEEIPIALQRFLPRVTAAGNAGSGYREGRTWREHTGTDIRQRIRTLEVSLNQPIYDGQAMPGLRAAEALILRARTQLLQAEQAVLLDAATAHASVVRDREILRLREAYLQSLGRLAGVTDRLLAAGDRTIGDLAQVRAQQARAASSLLQARSQLSASEATYFRAVTERPNDLAAPTLRFRAPQSRDEAVTSARADNARMLQFQIHHLK